MSTQDRPEESPLTAATVALPQAEARAREAQAPAPVVSLPDFILDPAHLSPPPLASAPTQQTSIEPRLQGEGTPPDPSTVQNLPPLPSSPSLTLASPRPVNQRESEQGETQNRGGGESPPDTRALAGSVPYREEAKDQGQSRQVFAIPYQVCLFEDFAELFCEASFEGVDGIYMLNLEGVSPFLYDPSIHITLSGGELLSSRVVRRWREEGKEAGGGQKHFQLREAAKQQESAARVLENLEARAARWERLQEAWEEALVAGAGKPEVLSDSYVELSEEADAIAEARPLAERELERARANYDALRAETEEQEESAQTPLVDRAIARVALQIRGQSGPCTLKLRYSIPSACWRPENLFDFDAESGTLRWRLRGYAWQRSGQPWTGLRGIFSTERSQASDGLRVLRPQVRLQQESRSGAPKFTLYEEQKSADGSWIERSAARPDLPQPDVLTRPLSIDDGGAPLRFRSDTPVELASDGKGRWFTLHEERLPARLTLIVEAQQSPVAHRVLEGRLETLLPIPAGQTRLLIGGGYQATKSTPYVPVGRAFRFDFGIAEEVRVHREVKRRLSDGRAHYTVHLTLSNLSSETRQVFLLERLVVSLHSEVQTRLIDCEGWSQEEGGQLVQSVMLAPQARQRFVYSYEIRTNGAVNFEPPLD